MHNRMPGSGSGGDSKESRSAARMKGLYRGCSQDEQTPRSQNQSLSGCTDSQEAGQGAAGPTWREDRQVPSGLGLSLIPKTFGCGTHRTLGLGGQVLGGLSGGWEVEMGALLAGEGMTVAVTATPLPWREGWEQKVGTQGLALCVSQDW